MYITSLVFLEKSSEGRSLRGVLIFLVLFLLVLSDVEASRKKEQIIIKRIALKAKRNFLIQSLLRE
jgi:hypothetical protein